MPYLLSYPFAVEMHITEIFQGQKLMILAHKTEVPLFKLTSFKK